MGSSKDSFKRKPWDAECDCGTCNDCVLQYLLDKLKLVAYPVGGEDGSEEEKEQAKTEDKG